MTDTPKRSAKHLRAENFATDPFWVKDFKPMLHAMIAGCMASLRNCPLDQVASYRARIDLLEKLERYPESAKNQEIVNALLEQAQADNTHQ